MPDNVTVSISADTTKFSADLAVAQVKLAEFTKQLKEAAKISTATGDNKLLLTAAKNAEIARATVLGLNKALIASRAAADAAIGNNQRGFTGLVTQTKTLADSVLKIDEGMGLLRGALAGTGLLAVADQVGVVNRELQDLQNTAKATNLSTEFIQAFQDALKQTGREGADATPILVKFSEALSKARLEAVGEGQTPGGPTVFRGTTDGLRSANNEVTTLRGNLNDMNDTMVNVLRGTKQVAADLSSPFKTAQMNVAQYAASIQGNEKALEDFARRLVQLKQAGRVDEADAAAFAAFGKRYAEVAPVLEQFSSSGNVQKLQEGLRAKGALVSPEDLARQKQYNDALSEMSTTLAGVRKEAVVSMFPWLSGQVKQATKDIEEMAASIKEVWGAVVPFITQLGAAVSEQWQKMFSGIVAQAKEAYQAFIGVLSAIPQFVEHLGQSVIDTVDATAKAIRNAVSTTGEASTASPFVAGGLVAGFRHGGLVPAMSSIRSGRGSSRGSTVAGYADGGVVILRGPGDGGGGAAGPLADAIANLGNVTRVLGELRKGNDTLLDWAVQSNQQVIGAMLNFRPKKGFASGGGVNGTDTVPAMLTPGEYVNRLSSVQYYGADLFHALNSRLIPRDLFRGWGYSLGGIVDSLHAPSRHYAEGGVVDGAGGRLAVDINMGGHTFPMSSDREVASRLVRFARSESMRSAGIKPSWVS